MIIVANLEADAGIQESVDRLHRGGDGLDALIAGVSLVERDTSVRSVGLGGWPNMLGKMEFDAAVMRGNDRRVGAVGAVPDTIDACQLAKEVMDRLPHVLLTGEGARRFASEIGFPQNQALLEDSKRVWWEKLAAEMTTEEAERFPDVELTKLMHTIADPIRVRDTTVFMCQDINNEISVATSTSGWAWKYPGRLGDSPVPGCGFYADSRYGAAACTHTGEMTLRSASAHTIILAMKLGRTLDEAMVIAAEELLELKGGFLGEVVLHAIDQQENHSVLAISCIDDVPYWFWRTGMAQPEKRTADKFVV